MNCPLMLSLDVEDFINSWSNMSCENDTGFQAHYSSTHAHNEHRHVSHGYHTVSHIVIRQDTSLEPQIINCHVPHYWLIVSRYLFKAKLHWCGLSTQIKSPKMQMKNLVFCLESIWNGICWICQVSVVKCLIMHLGTWKNRSQQLLNLNWWNDDGCIWLHCNETCGLTSNRCVCHNNTIVFIIGFISKLQMDLLRLLFVSNILVHKWVSLILDLFESRSCNN